MRKKGKPSLKLFKDALDKDLEQLEVEYPIWYADLEYFQSIKSELLEDGTYVDKYIAIRNKKIIDSDKDEIKLALRIEKAYPDKVVFIAKVDEKENIGVVRSPRAATAS